MGPLTGLRVVEIASLAPAPFGATLLADLGADVVVVDRPGGTEGGVGALQGDPLRRNRRSVTVDLKRTEGVDLLLRLTDTADVFIEGFRPGVTERLGFGPDVVSTRNPRIVYARMTGWGQTGPLADTAGHDIDYIAISGALDLIGRSGQRPHAPVNFVGDFGGGGLFMAFGILAALYEREKSGLGQVVDAAMVDGASLLTTFIHGMHAAGSWGNPRGQNLLDGGAPFYDTYECSDGGFLAVGAIEPKFYAALLVGLGLDTEELPDQYDATRWAELRERFTAVIGSRSRADWEVVFGGSDACVSPVLSIDEAPTHPYNAERGVFVEVGGVVQPAPGPRFGRTPADVPRPAPATTGQDAHAVLAELGLGPAEQAELRAQGVIG